MKTEPRHVLTWAVCAASWLSPALAPALFRREPCSMEPGQWVEEAQPVSDISSTEDGQQAKVYEGNRRRNGEPRLWPTSPGLAMRGMQEGSGGLRSWPAPPPSPSSISLLFSSKLFPGCSSSEVDDKCMWVASPIILQINIRRGRRHGRSGWS